MTDLPIVCTLQTRELNARAAELLPGLAATALNGFTIDNGYRFEFDAASETLSAVINMIQAERRCCRFLRFQLTVEANGGPITLDVTGPSGAQEFLAAMIAPV